MFGVFGRDEAWKAEKKKNLNKPQGSTRGEKKIAAYTLEITVQKFDFSLFSCCLGSAFFQFLRALKVRNCQIKENIAENIIIRLLFLIFDLSRLIFLSLQVSDDDSYISDVSDTISMDTCSNEGNAERQNSGMSNRLRLPTYDVRFSYQVVSGFNLISVTVVLVGSAAATLVRRRSTLPSPRPSSSVSLWNILRNNIGKDLSKVAMPVQLNEPLNTLQRLCEELEHSELLDTANQTPDPYQRMVREEGSSWERSPLFKMLSGGVLFCAGIRCDVCDICVCFHLPPSRK